MQDNSTIPAMQAEDLTLTDEERSELEEIGPKAPSISFRNQDFDVAGLVKRLNNGDILIPRIRSHEKDSNLLEMNAFQRGFVWNRRQMDSFIESLLLEYPIPGLFLVQQNDRKLIVLDGQQRLETLRRFYSGLCGDKKYRLRLPDAQFDKKSYDELPEKYRRILDDTYITSTVIILDNTPDSYESVYDVFARLNSGGTQLTPHEIRMALYNGPLMETIDEINMQTSWRRLYGSEVPNKRFRDHELILRIIALYLDEDSYVKPLGGFLNRFAKEHRNGSDSRGDALACAVLLFKQAADLLIEARETPFSTIGSRQLNAARAESIMVALMDVIDKQELQSVELIREALSDLDEDEKYGDAITGSTSDDALVHSRIAIAKRAFAQ